jgi:hypothetical protein
MLRQTFVHIPGVGRETELRLWKSGILSWDDFIAHYSEISLPDKRKREMRPHVEASIMCLERHDHGYFSRVLPRSELWRACQDFPGRVAYLDIETTGLFQRTDEITVIGIYDGKDAKAFINGDNLGSIEKELKKYSVLITFNGARFDLPFIARFLPHITLDHLHIDLLYPLRRLGYRGGLKSIERQLGIGRDSSVVHLSGWDAVRLWKEYRGGSKSSLETLIKYNASDIINLEYLMRFAYDGLKKKAMEPEVAPPS